MTPVSGPGGDVDAAAEQRWREWQVRGAEADRHWARLAIGSFALAFAALLAWLLTRL